MSEDKIALEVAEAEFDRFTEIWDIEPDLSGFSAEEHDSFGAHKSRIVKEIRNGNAVIDDEGRVVYTLKYSKENSPLTELVFDVSRASKAVMDQFKDRQAIRKTEAYIGSLVGQPPKTIHALDPRDQKFGEAVMLLFLAQ
ncbi:MAG: hypothetical protein KAR06_04420 [Deltaproteobacteria bacterium]|nr:hypothetical protein [Deltaproteobacteria bacterium]